VDPVQAIEAFLRRQALKQGPRTLLLAVSGGADSMALLVAGAQAASARGWTTQALHCDHGLRGRASELDAVLVARTCARLGVPLHTFETALGKGPNLEERARRWRRACFAKAAKVSGARLILLAHHVRDQAETLLLNLVRGSGPAGAAAMLDLGPLDEGSGLRIGRPFLTLEPEALRSWLRSQGQAWREDASNRDLSLARNRIRLKVLPQLEAVNPRAASNLAAYASGLSAGKQARDLAGLLHLDRAARGRAAAVLARGRGKADLGRGWSLDLSAGNARVEAPAGVLALDLGVQRWNEWRLELKLAVPTARKLGETGAFWFSPELLKKGPRIRALKPGEKLRPFGFAGRRKAADLLREAGVPLWARETWPALEAEGRLLALVGVRRGSGLEAGPGTRSLRLAWKHAGVDKPPLQ